MDKLIIHFLFTLGSLYSFTFSTEQHNELTSYSPSVVNSPEGFNNFPGAGIISSPTRLRGARLGDKCIGVCTCSLPRHDVLIVDCSRAGTNSNITEVLTKGDLPVPAGGEVRLVIMSSEIVSLYNEIFATIGLTQIHVKYNHGLSFVSRTVLESSNSSLRVLDLRNNNLTHFPLGTFNGLEKLEFLSLDDNKISNIPSWVANISSLIHLSVANNELVAIDDGGLHGLDSLMFLDLHNNKFNFIPESVSNLSNLRTLILWGNPIKNLAADGLQQLYYLQYIDLSLTSLTVIEKCSLSSPTAHPWYLSLAHTPLTSIDTHAFCGGQLPAWLNIRNCEMTSLEEDVFKLIVENMSDENIVHVDWGKPQLWASDNKLSCDCSIKWLATNSSLQRHASGKCYDKNISLRLLDPDYYHTFCF